MEAPAGQHFYDVFVGGICADPQAATLRCLVVNLKSLALRKLVQCGTRVRLRELRREPPSFLARVAKGRRPLGWLRTTRSRLRGLRRCGTRLNAELLAKRRLEHLLPFVPPVDAVLVAEPEDALALLF